jgi:hypothetical protein
VPPQGARLTAVRTPKKTFGYPFFHPPPTGSNSNIQKKAEKDTLINYLRGGGGKGAPAGGALGRRQDPEKNFWVSFSHRHFFNSELLTIHYALLKCSSISSYNWGVSLYLGGEN